MWSHMKLSLPNEKPPYQSLKMKVIYMTIDYCYKAKILVCFARFNEAFFITAVGPSEYFSKVML